MGRSECADPPAKPRRRSETSDFVAASPADCVKMDATAGPSAVAASRAARTAHEAHRVRLGLCAAALRPSTERSTRQSAASRRLRSGDGGGGGGGGGCGSCAVGGGGCAGGCVCCACSSCCALQTADWGVVSAMASSHASRSLSISRLPSGTPRPSASRSSRVSSFDTRASSSGGGGETVGGEFDGGGGVGVGCDGGFSMMGCDGG
eukprot:6212776-Pleurochrysis_carterae.AAC.2